MSLKDFKDSVLKRNKSKTSKIRNSWGSYDAYKSIRKHQWYDIGRPLKEGEFYSIVRRVNNLLAENLSNGETVVFPSRLGKLELRKSMRGASIVDNRLHVTYPVNWDETIKLWYEDQQARQDKVLLRNEEKYVFRVKYCKHDAAFENKVFYSFTLNRRIKKALKEKINRGEIDTLW